MTKALVVVPTYNETENIGQLISAINTAADVDVLVVDDSSPDKTYEIVESIQKEHENVKLIVREGKRGLGTAYIEGFKYAIENKYDYIMEMDADFSHNPDDIPRFLEEIDSNDLVIGSRYIRGIRVVNWPLYRLALSYFASKYVQTILRLPVKDPTGGFKCFRREVLEAIDLDRVKSNGYSFQVELNYKAWKKGFKIKEMPIIFTDRYLGKTKMSKKVIWEAVWMVWKLRFGK
ncbi:polyprenol monophosphomannose synthase [Candidatus Margulisiibacteriota bacterium]